MIDGGYELGYSNCDCFWGTEPGSMVRSLVSIIPSVRNLRVLDLGCGEGKNATYLANQGAIVRAIDVSLRAIENGKRTFGTPVGLTWEAGDVRDMPFASEQYDVVIAYGVFHCFDSPEEIAEVIRKLKNSTARSGFHLVCAFNDRFQDLSAHPGFRPTLISHDAYVKNYSDWELIHASDSDLTETHPHNGIEHRHSLTRMIVRRHT